MHNTYKHLIRVIPHSVVHSPAIFDNMSLDLKNAYIFSPTHPLPFSVWYSHLAASLSPAGIPSAQALWRRDFQLPAQLQSTSQSCSSRRLTKFGSHVIPPPFFFQQNAMPPPGLPHPHIIGNTFLTSYSCKPLLLHFSSNLKHSDILYINGYSSVSQIKGSCWWTRDRWVLLVALTFPPLIAVVLGQVSCQHPR